MRCKNNCRFSACNCAGIVLSIIFGVIIGVLFAFELIPGIATGIWIAFGFAGLAAVLWIAGVYAAAASASEPLATCLCGNSRCLAVGIIGTFVTTIIALTLDLVAPSLLGAALIALGAFFFSFTGVGLLALIACIVCEMCSAL